MDVQNVERIPLLGLLKLSVSSVFLTFKCVNTNIMPVQCCHPYRINISDNKIIKVKSLVVLFRYFEETLYISWTCSSFTSRFDSCLCPNYS
jgi:hypothetical protein